MNTKERIPLTANLYLDEYFPKEMYQLAGNKDVLIKLLDPKLIKSDQALRDLFGPVTINSWWVGGDRNYSGIRPADCKVGAKASDHKLGKASDKLFKNATAEEVREYIRKNFKTLGITKIEENITWVHTSVAFTGKPYLVKFFP